jgi:hypothetical protein
MLHHVQKNQRHRKKELCVRVPDIGLPGLIYYLHSQMTTGRENYTFEQQTS